MKQPLLDNQNLKNPLKIQINKKHRLYLIGVYVSSFCIVMASCKNDLEKINSIKNYTNLPVESAKNISLIRSDSTRIILLMTSPQLDRYQTEQSYSKFPKGLKVVFYDINKKIKSQLTANYAINYEDNKTMEIKNNVIIIDFAKGDTIYTENLNWDQNSKKIFSNTLVKKVNKDETLYGDGFDSDESFNNYTLRRPRGKINLDKEE